jgi:Ca2+/Na+ antiporter
MENTLSLYLKKYGIAAGILVDQLICIFILQRGQDYESSKMYVHLGTLVLVAFMWVKYPEYQRLHWKAMLAIVFLLLIFYLLVAL